MSWCSTVALGPSEVERTRFKVGSVAGSVSQDFTRAPRAQNLFGRKAWQSKDGAQLLGLQHGHIVGRDLRIRREDRQRFHLRLRHQQTVERVTVM